MRYIDINKFMNNKLWKSFEQAYKADNYALFEQELRTAMNVDYSLNRESWDKIKGEHINVVCLDNKHLKIAYIIEACYAKLGHKTDIVKKFLYQPEDKTIKLLECVERELWTAIEYVVEHPTDDNYDALAEKLMREYNLGNISETQYTIMARGCGLKEYMEATLEVDEMDLTVDKAYQFMEDMAGGYSFEFGRSV